MPTGSRVHKMKVALQRDGWDEGSAIRIAQSKTGMSYKTGRPPKHKTVRKGQRKR